MTDEEEEEEGEGLIYLCYVHTKNDSAHCLLFRGTVGMQAYARCNITLPLYDYLFFRYLGSRNIFYTTHTRVTEKFSTSVCPFLIFRCVQLCSARATN